MKQVMDKSSGSPGDARAKMREIHKTANTQIRAILAADQKATFDKMQEEHRKQMEERRGGNDQGAPPPDRL
jgi:Spy/CpxP family protein refolding chaperone